MSDHSHHAVTTAGCCDGCEPQAPTRNHYFTGKLLVERDFTDEQRYFREKIRLHHQRLHGVGVVCGLRIVQHPNPACRDRMVILEPGSAVDCCGHDILVVEPETLVLDDFPAIKALKEHPDEKDHRLQFCLTYRECPTEEIPVLFDECGCDDTQCAPNRILESFAVEVRVDPPLPEPGFHAPKLEWLYEAGVAHAAFVALDEPNERMFVITGDDAATLYQVSLTKPPVFEASFPLGRKALGLAVSPDGATLAVASRPANKPNDPATLDVFTPNGVGGIGAGPARSGVVTGATGAIDMAMAADGRLVLLGRTNGALRVFPPTIPAPVTPSATRDIGSARLGLALGASDIAYVAEPGTGKIGAVDLGAAALPETVTTVTGVAIDALALAPQTAGERLAVLDQAAKAVRLIDIASGTVLGSATLPAKPVALAVAQGAHWAFVATDDGTTGAVVAVDLGRLADGQPFTPATGVPTGKLPAGLTINVAGNRIYAAYVEDLAVPTAGDVAVIEVREADCWGVLEGKDCPGCVTPDCVVLATVDGYRPGRKLEDLPGFASDAANGIARIDNDTWRVLLPSTQAIAQALLCLKHAGPGVAGPPGQDGKDGKDGTNGTNGTNGANGTNGTNGTDGKDGKDALDPTLTHVCSINWEHRGDVKLTTIMGRRGEGLVIVFDRPVTLADIDRCSLQFQVEDRDEETGLTCWCDWTWPREGGLEGLRFDAPCDTRAKATVVPGPFVEGVRWRPDRKPRPRIRDDVRVRVLLHGDLIRDKDGRAVDGEHLPKWLPGRRSGDGIEGGLFESWFTLTFDD